MGSFGKAVTSIASVARQASMNAFYRMEKQIPAVFRNQMQSAQNRLMQKVAKQYIPPKAIQFKRTQMPMSTKAPGEPTYSPSYGKLLQQRSMKGSFVAHGPGLAERQPYRPSLFWKMNPTTRSFMANRRVVPGTTMPVHSSQVGAMSPLYRKS